MTWKKSINFPFPAGWKKSIAIDIFRTVEKVDK